jgi:glycosyltransferase involved in cell wall biosynthesis
VEQQVTPDYGISGESIICFAGEDWWYHHPHSKNHILKRLAQCNKVLFVNSLSMGLPSISNPDFFLKIRRKLKSQMRWLRKAPEDLWVLTPIALPFFGSASVRALNQVLLVLQLKLAMKLCGMSQPIIWVAIPSAVDAIEPLNPKIVVYQVSDKYDANRDSSLSGNVIRTFHERLKKMAAVVMYSGRKLYEEATEPHRYFLEQAVDFEHFATGAAITAPEVADIPRPVLGFIGWMDYVIDVELIEHVSRLRPDWHWIFVGTKTNLVQLAAPNLHFVGAKPYAELPKYLRHMDVCVLPYSQKDAFTSYGSAIKVKEYLATGKPVVISPLYEYLDVPGIRVFRTTEEFLAAVEDALANDTAAMREWRQQAVRDCTWDARTRQVGELLRALVEKRQSRVAQLLKAAVPPANAAVSIGSTS